ncbi:hypothetical protein SNE40_004970 [Patella caerulea]|uniref:Uncharacterized protein n=1 Tax=Patella caerulea TaxID=87958 RepID=A0AAN8KA05_PATCE
MKNKKKKKKNSRDNIYHHLNLEQDSTDNDSDDEFGLILTTPKRQKSDHKGANLFVPANILQSPKLAAVATRMKMTPTQQAAYTAALIGEIGGDTNQVYTSYAFTDKH